MKEQGVSEPDRDALSNRLRLLELILDNIYNGVIVTDAEGTVIYFNKPYGQFLGIDPETQIGKHATEVIENTRMHIVAKTGKAEINKPHKIKGQQHGGAAHPHQAGRKSGRRLRAGHVQACQRCRQTRQGAFLPPVQAQTVRRGTAFPACGALHLRQHPRNKPGDPEPEKRGDAGGGDELSGADYRRVGHGQRDVRPGHTQRQSQKAASVHPHQLCLDPPGSCSNRNSSGTKRAPLPAPIPPASTANSNLPTTAPCFWTRSATCPRNAAQNPARIGRKGDGAHRRGRPGEIGLPAYRCKQSAHGRDGQRRQVPEGPFLPTQRHPLPYSAARERRDDIITIAKNLLAGMAGNTAFPEIKIHPAAEDDIAELRLAGQYTGAGQCAQPRNLPVWNGTPSSRTISLFSCGAGKATEGVAVRTSLGSVMDTAEKDAIISALASAGNNKTAAAALLCIHSTHLYKKMKKYGI